jgi:hypothetical protein
LYDADYPPSNISQQRAPYFDSLIQAVEKKDERPFVLFVLGSFEKTCRTNLRSPKRPTS